MALGETIKIVSANVQGIQTLFKRRDVLNYLENMSPNIICLQDAHLKQEQENDVKNLTNADCYISGNRTNARGVGVIFKNNFAYNIINVFRDNEGNYIVIDFETSDTTFRLINTYAPNIDSPQFFIELRKFIDENEQMYLVNCGDFNLVLDPDMDCKNYININNPQSRQILLETLNVYDLVDSFRYFHPKLRRYSWRRRNPVKQARLDYFIISKSLTDLILSSLILPGYKSDHSILELTIEINTFIRGRGVFKLNCDCLKDIEYLTTINNVISQEKLAYALPIYSREYIENNDCDIIFTIDDKLFLEVLLLKIRGETIKYCSLKKKTNLKKELELKKEILLLENKNQDDQVNLLNSKKHELVELRENHLRGHLVRSRSQWLVDGEKPSKYFCALEHKKFIDKTIKKLVLNNGQILTTQSEILDKIQKFYANLFSNKDDELDYINMHEKFPGNSIKKLENVEAQKLEGLLTLKELSTTLKNMKNNKTPGIDGFPADFFKVFWSKLKYFVLRSLNLSFKTGELPTSACKCIINCIPKGDKERTFLKNWRPISLLSIIYKLASASIACRIKAVLPNIISTAQSGFVDGRFIGDTTRLVYDIMSFTELKQIDGLLMLIDFEKAFDSVSWSFIYNAFEFYGFGNDILKWIKLFNTNISASILQSGILSDSFPIQRGCKQGDPIASLQFIICAQILYLMIMENPDIRGIFFGNEEVKASMFADDTTLTLDGTQRSLQAALNTLEIFGSFSGLKMNMTKTKLIWIGRKKYSKDKLPVTANLEWGETKFTLLGIKYDVDLNNMLSLNYENAKVNILKTISTWKKRYLTPFGKITIIKTLLLSKLNHLFLTLPSPSQKFFKEINSILYKYIWNDKPDKIKRNLINQSYNNGGLKMVNLEKFIKSLKVTWMRRLLSNQETPWKNLFEASILPIRNLTIFGSNYLIKNAKNIQNHFWKNVLSDWNSLLDKIILRTNNDLLVTPLWYNPKICANMYFPKWCNIGIIFLADILNENGIILPLQDIITKFPSLRTNFLEYYKLKHEITNFISHNQKSNNFQQSLPLVPQHVQLLFKSKKGCRDFYSIQNQKQVFSQYAFSAKWRRDLLVNIDENNWKHIFKICFKTVNDQKLIWLQYRILHRILGVKYLRFKMGKEYSALCDKCGLSDQTIGHMFTECTFYNDLWKNLQSWIKENCTNHFNLSPQMKILGYLNTDNLAIPINTILLVTKYYIFMNSLIVGKCPNIGELLRLIKNTYCEQLLAAKLSQKFDLFSKTWSNFSTIIENI